MQNDNNEQAKGISKINSLKNVGFTFYFEHYKCQQANWRYLSKV